MDDSLRAELRAQIFALLAALAQKGKRLSPARESVRAEGFLVTIQLEEEKPIALREADTALLENAPDFVPVKVLARRAGLDYAYARRRVARMLRLGVMERGEGGVRRKP